MYSALNAHALGALAEVAGAGFNTHLGTILPALLSAMGGENKVKKIKISSLLYLYESYCYLWLRFSFFLQEVQELAQEAAERVVLVIDEEGVETLLSELLKGVSDSQVCL